MRVVRVTPEHVVAEGNTPIGGEFIAARLPEVGQQLLERESVLTQGHAKVALVSEVVRWRIDSAVIQLSCLRMFQWQWA